MGVFGHGDTEEAPLEGSESVDLLMAKTLYCVLTSLSLFTVYCI